MSAVSHLLDRHLLKLIVLSYGLAAAYPALGLWIKDAEILHLVSPHGGVAMTPPKLLLALLLLNAGLRVRVADRADRPPPRRDDRRSGDEPGRPAGRDDARPAGLAQSRRGGGRLP